MNSGSREAKRLEVVELLRKQADVLETRSLGIATEAEILDYELRQEVIRELCTELANSQAA